MEHACHKCAASVEDGTPFCPQCNAPQIRVSGVEPAPSTIPQAAAASATRLTTGILWSAALRSSAIALVAAFLLILLRVPAGLGMVAAGFLCVLLYRHRCPFHPLSAGTGAWLGVVTGVLGFAAFAVVLALTAALRPGEIHATFLNAIQQYTSHNSDPRLQQVIPLLQTPQGFVLVMALGLAMTLVGFLIFSGLGGLIGAVLLRRKDRL